MNPRWNRDEALQELRSHLWRYLSQAAAVEAIESVIEDLWQLSTGETRRLAATHVALDPATARMIDEAPRALHRLRSTVYARMDEESGRLTGPVVWQKTFERRLQTGQPTLFVSRPSERQYDTAEARLVALCLRSCSDLGGLTGLNTDSALGRPVMSPSRTARHLLGHAKLEGVTKIRDVPERVLESLGRRGYQAFVDYWRLFRDAVANLLPQTVADVVAHRLLSPADDEALFELLVGFRLLGQFERTGFTSSFGGLLTGGQRAFASASGRGVKLTLWWQRSPWNVLPDWREADSVYGEVLASAGLARSGLRPDFILEFSEPARKVVLVEAKHTSRAGFAPDRTGVFDALAYLQDAEGRFAPSTLPHIIVVAQNSSATPALHRIMVSGPDKLDAAVSLLLDGLPPDDQRTS
jgi:hypothetical protein